MEEYETTGVDPYEDDTDSDELPAWLYAVLTAAVGSISALFAWLKR